MTLYILLRSTMMFTNMPRHSGVLLALAIAQFAVAQTSQVDVTDISSWPPCSVSIFLLVAERSANHRQQQCIPEGFGPPANCGSLSNLDCICRNGAFTASIAQCEQDTCTLAEKDGMLTPIVIVPPRTSR